jgi:hypothetical protein
MNNLKLLPGEHRVFSTQNDEFVLTNRRLRSIKKSRGQTNLISIHLNELASCELKSFDHRILFNLALFFLFSGMYLRISKGDTNGFVGALFIAVILVSTYLLTRSQGVNFSSTGGTALRVQSKAGLEACIELIEKVEQAKDNCHNNMPSSPTSPTAA